MCVLCVFVYVYFLFIYTSYVHANKHTNKDIYMHRLYANICGCNFCLFTPVTYMQTNTQISIYIYAQTICFYIFKYKPISSMLIHIYLHKYNSMYLAECMKLYEDKQVPIEIYIYTLYIQIYIHYLQCPLLFQVDVDIKTLISSNELNLPNELPMTRDQYYKTYVFVFALTIKLRVLNQTIS